MFKPIMSNTIHISSDISIEINVFFIGKDILIIITGGETHIGAISFSTREENRTWIDPPHKEFHITEAVEQIFSSLIPNSRIVVLSGIHFDQIEKEAINMIMERCNQWAKQTAPVIKQRIFND